MIRSRLTSLLLVGLTAFTIPLAAQQRLSLQQCRDLAKVNSRALQQKDAERESAHARRQEVFTKFFPQVAARGLYLHMQKDFRLIDWNQPLGSLNFLIPDACLRKVPLTRNEEHTS